MALENKELNKIYEGKEEELKQGMKELTPMKRIKLTMALKNDPKAFFFLKNEIAKGRTPDQISLDEFKKAGAKNKTIQILFNF